MSEHTVYRDIGDLIGSGIPIDGEAGVGYLLRDEYRLPPLMFTGEELKARALGAQMVRTWSDEKMASTMAIAIRKIEAILPDKLKKETQLEAIKVPDFGVTKHLKENLERVRLATDENRKLSIDYLSLRGEQTERMIWPMMLYFWGNKWTLGAWCELREDFRSFRIDLIGRIEETGKFYQVEPGRDLAAYLEYQSFRDW